MQLKLILIIYFFVRFCPEITKKPGKSFMVTQYVIDNLALL